MLASRGDDLKLKKEEIKQITESIYSEVIVE